MRLAGKKKRFGRIKPNFKVIFILIICLLSLKAYMSIKSHQIYSDEEWEGATVYLVPSTHSDQYWKAEWAGSNMNVFNLEILEALEMFRKNPNFRYTIDQASIAQAFMYEYPQHADEFRQAVKNGQLFIAGSGVSQQDLNIPNGEGIIRNVLLGKKWFEEEFGYTTDVAWQVDTFGAASTTPSILAALDYNYLYYKRDGRGYEDGAYWWVGPDGSEILNWKTHYGRYPFTAPDLIGMINYYIGDTDAMSSSLPSGSFMLHIGGDKTQPLKALMDFIQTWNAFYAKRSGYRVKVSTPKEFFEAIKEEAQFLPKHGFGVDNNPYDEGSYVSNIQTKMNNRRWESRSITAEKFATFGKQILNLTQVSNPSELYSGWWKNSLFHHHDTITGTSPYEIVEDFIIDYEKLGLLADSVQYEVLRSMMAQINFTGLLSDTVPEQNPDGFITIFNPETVETGQYRSELIDTTLFYNLTLDDLSILQSLGFDIDGADNDLHLLDSSEIDKIAVRINDTSNGLPSIEIPSQIKTVRVLSLEDYDLQPTTYLLELDIEFYASVKSVGYNTYSYEVELGAPETTFNTTSFDEEVQYFVDSGAGTNGLDLVTIQNGIYNITWDMGQGGNIINLTNLMMDGGNGFNYLENASLTNSSMGFRYIDASNDLYDGRNFGLIDESKNYDATYSIKPGVTTLEPTHLDVLSIILTIDIPMPWYNISASYHLGANSSLIDMEISYEFLENDNSNDGSIPIANNLEFSLPWDEFTVPNANSASWLTGAPYGVTDRTGLIDKFLPYMFPATYWSVMEMKNALPNGNDWGLAFYDKAQIARDWDTTENVSSITLIHQNDPYFLKEEVENDPRVEFEKEDFLYNEQDNLTLKIGLELYENNYSVAQIPQNARNFNFPMAPIAASVDKQGGILDESFSALVSSLESIEQEHIFANMENELNKPSFPENELGELPLFYTENKFNHYLTSQYITETLEQLPTWASFISFNDSQTVLGAFKTAEIDNSAVIRLMTYEHLTSEDLEINFLENLQDPQYAKSPTLSTLLNTEEVIVKETSAMEVQGSINNAYLKNYTFDKDNLKFIIPIEDLVELSVKTMLIPLVNDVQSPYFSVELPQFASIGSELEVTLNIIDESSILPQNIIAFYSEDEGATWKEFDGFQIVMVEDLQGNDGRTLHRYIATATVTPSARSQVFFKIIIADEFGNEHIIGHFDSTYSLLRINVSDGGLQNLLYPNAPQVLATWPWYVFAIVISILLAISVGFMKLTNRHNYASNAHKVEENVRSKTNKRPRIKILIGYIAALTIFTFLYQSLAIFKYTDTVSYRFFDEYLLDLIQLFRTNSYYVPAYLWTVFLSLVAISWAWKKQWSQSDVKDDQLPFWFGLIVFVIPLVTGCIQFLLHAAFGSVGSIGEIKQSAEILFMVTNPVLLGITIMVVFSPIIVGRLLPVKYLDYTEKQIKKLVKYVVNKKKGISVEIENPNEVEEDSSINQKSIKYSLKAKIQELKSKKWTFFALKSWSIFWITLMFGVFVYFTTIIFIDYFTIYLDGEALGSLSESQALVIWIYYIFGILVGCIVSVVYSLLHEIMPEKLRKPFQVSIRLKVWYISQIISVFTAIIYYIILQAQIPIAEINISLFFLYLPSIFLSGKTIILTLIFVGLPAVIFHLIFYPIKAGGRWLILKIKTSPEIKKTLHSRN